MLTKPSASSPGWMRKSYFWSRNQTHSLPRSSYLVRNRCYQGTDGYLAYQFLLILSSMSNARQLAIQKADEALLAKLGYKQEFRREFTPLEVDNI